MYKWPVAILYDAAGNAIKVIQDGSDYLLGIASKLRNAAGTIINPSTEDTLDGVKTNQESVISAGNSSVAQLAADIAFVGTGVDCLGFSAVSITVHSDMDSAVDGMKFQFSLDNTNWDDSYGWTLDASKSTTRRFQFPVTTRYFRVNYTNGDTLTTEFRCQTILHRQNIMTSVHRLKDTVAADRSVEITKGGIIAQHEGSSAEDFVPIEAVGNSLKVHMDEQSEDPIHVIISMGRRSYYHLNLTNADEPAAIETGVDEPYDVGGDTLTIDVNTVEQTSTFATRVAQPGIHYSAQHPKVANGGHKKLKVAIEGGALTEVVIAEDLTTGDAIAAALQVEIRANVENGSSATVEYNTVDYPFRYVFKSGTTGASSVMHLEKADDLAKDMLLVQWGGTERPGTAADTYWAFEVVEQLSADLTNVIIYQEGGGVYIETVGGGPTKSLQVTAGGANTALQFPTTLVSGVAGSGDESLVVDGSATSIRFSITPPTDELFTVEKLLFFIRDDGAALNKFGGQDQLTNGVTLEVKSEDLPLIPYFTATTNADLMTQADEGELIDNAFPGGGHDLVKTTFDFSPGLRLQQGVTANAYVTVQDDLTGLNEFYVRARGWVEAPSE